MIICPKCQTQARERWIAKREQELLETSYFHVVFTVPHELNVLALNNPREFYELLFRASAAQTFLSGEACKIFRHERCDLSVLRDQPAMRDAS